MKTIKPADGDTHWQVFIKKIITYIINGNRRVVYSAWQGFDKEEKEKGYMQKLYDRRSKSVIALATALVLTVSGIAAGTDVNAASKKQPTLSKKQKLVW